MAAQNWSEALTRLVLRLGGNILVGAQALTRRATPRSVRLNRVFTGNFRILSVYVIVQSTCYYLTAALVHFYRSSFAFPETYFTQAYIGIAALFGISVFLIAVSKSVYTIALICLSTFVSLVLGYPINEHLEIEVTLYLPLLVECQILLNRPASSILGSVVVGAAVLFQRSSLSWGQTVEAPEAAQLLVLCGILGIFFVLLQATNGYLAHILRKREEIDHLEQTVKQLTQANLGFQEYSVLIEEQSRATERNRITRELHDVVGYTLTNITMMMEEGIDLFKQKDLQGMLAVVIAARDQARQGHAGTRNALRRLRTINSRNKTYVNAIHGIINTFKNATGMDVKVEYTNFPQEIDDSVGGCILRLVQEGMTNALRHGRATKATIVLAEDKGDLVLNFYDNGRGCLNLQEGLGITGMRERVAQLRGIIDFNSEVDGFQFIARIPNKNSAGLDP